MGDGDTSRFLSFVLRHDPGSIGLELDGGGWPEVTALIARSAAAGRAGLTLSRISATPVDDRVRGGRITHAQA